MKDELFDELLESVNEGAAILKGEQKPSRAFVLEKSEIQRIRASYNMTQSEFARLMGINLNTLKNWEQGRRKPQGPARVLLQVVAGHPEVVREVVEKGGRDPKKVRYPNLDDSGKKKTSARLVKEDKS